MKKNFYNSADKTELLDRLGRLQPDSAARWGKMTAHQMVLHLIDSFCMALGKRPVKDKSNILSRTLVKWILLGRSFMPKNVATAPELDQKRKGTPPKEWTEDVERLRALMDEMANLPQGAPMARHPFFGKMSRHQWGLLAYQHTHHHLTQFGL